MNTITPIVIPMHTEPERCPKCSRTKNVKVVCRECGYEYPDVESEFSWWYVLVLLVAIVVFLWVFLTAMEWLFGYRDKPLVEILIDQLDWLRSRRIY